MSATSGNLIRILHVDDDPDFADLVTTALEREDERFAVETVTSAEEGVDRLSEDVDCVVSDYEMPGTNGIELLKTVRERHPTLPFILFTGKGSEAVASDAISAGVTDYLQKCSGMEQFELLANRITNAVEQTRARRRAKEQHRINTVIREINQALVHATSRERINQRVCEIFAEADPYQFAWIGVVAPETDRIVPQASAGADDGYLEEITVTADHSPTGQGPGGTAVREDRVAVSQNVREDEEFVPWREQALERGFLSVAAIPLSYDDRQYGVLIVYADRLDAFDESERSLLAELGDTIAHAYHRLDIQSQFEDQYRGLFAEAPVMFVFTREVDGKPIIEDCNVRFAETLGYTREALCGRPLAELYTEESAAELLDGGGYDRALLGEFEQEQRELVTREGDHVTVLLRASPRRNRDGDIVGTHALFVDITDQTRLETLEALRERMEFALEATDSILFETDLQTRRETRHGPFERLYGIEPDRAMTSEEFYARCVHPDDRERLREMQRTESLEDGSGILECEFRTHPGRGSERWIRMEAYVSSDPDGTPRRLIGLDTDVTARKEREQDLERYETFVEASGDPLFTLDADGLITFVNEAFVDLTGYDRDHLIGKHPSVFTTPEDIEQGERIIRSLVETPAVRETFEVDIITSDGERIPCENHVALLPSDDEFRGTVGILRDISARVEREVELERQNERLEEFASLVSHDLRNPLTVASGNLELARERCDCEELDAVANAHDRMRDIIENLLTLARSGASIDELETIDLATLGRICWDTVATADATLVVETDYQIRADRARVRQLLENLMRNAVDHGGEDVTATLGPLESGFYVADDGPGIPEEEREQVLESGYSTSEEGIGLGLAIVQEIVDAHGWEIRLTDSADGGARFEITGVETIP
jgi:PAS domain S-box-containing protein